MKRVNWHIPEAVASTCGTMCRRHAMNSGVMSGVCTASAPLPFVILSLYYANTNAPISTKLTSFKSHLYLLFL